MFCWLNDQSWPLRGQLCQVFFVLVCEGCFSEEEGPLQGDVNPCWHLDELLNFNRGKSNWGPSCHQVLTLTLIYSIELQYCIALYSYYRSQTMLTERKGHNCKSHLLFQHHGQQQHGFISTKFLIFQSHVRAIDPYRKRGWKVDKGDTSTLSEEAQEQH